MQPRGEGVRGVLDGERERRVPRHQRERRAPGDVVELDPPAVDVAPLDVGTGAEPGRGAAEHVRDVLGDQARDRDRDAGVDGLDRAEHAGAGGEGVGEPVERVGPERGVRRPRALMERAVGGRDRVLDGLRGRREARRDRLAGVGVLERAVERVRGRAARAADQVELVSVRARGQRRREPMVSQLRL